VIDLSERTVRPGFIDNHVYLTMDAANIALQTLQSSKAKALKRLSLAREYMNYGFTTLRDLGSVDPEWPTIDLRNALNSTTTCCRSGSSGSIAHASGLRSSRRCPCRAATISTPTPQRC
jgi:imidazolonepropionase-like amidohydrolase